MRELENDRVLSNRSLSLERIDGGDGVGHVTYEKSSTFSMELPMLSKTYVG
jgi:hypothetical protein